MYIILKSLGFYPHNRSITGMIQLRVKICARRLGEGWGGGDTGRDGGYLWCTLSHPRGVIIHTVLLYLTMCFCNTINGGNHLVWNLKKQQHKFWLQLVDLPVVANIIWLSRIFELEPCNSIFAFLCAYFAVESSRFIISRG